MGSQLLPHSPATPETRVSDAPQKISSHQRGTDAGADLSELTIGGGAAPNQPTRKGGVRWGRSESNWSGTQRSSGLVGVLASFNLRGP